MNAVPVLDRTIQKTHVWLRDALCELDWVSQQRAYLAFRAVLQALRDRLTLQEMAQLGAQLPTFIRGVYYEGWNPSHTPLKNRKKEPFLAEVRKHFVHTRNPDIDPEHVVRAILRVLDKHISKGELDQVRSVLPHEIRELWSTQKAA